MKRSPFPNKAYVWNRKTSLNQNVSFKNNRVALKSFRSVIGEDVMGVKVWQVDEADMKFSIFIRQRDGHCLRCGTIFFLTCSHFFKRAIYNTRFDPDNCITLCVSCHDIWENKKDGEYKEFMFNHLGTINMQLLISRSKVRVSPYFAILEFMKFSFENDLKVNSIHY